MTRRGTARYDWKLVGTATSFLLAFYLYSHTTINASAHIFVVLVASVQMFLIELRVQNTLRLNAPLVHKATLFGYNTKDYSLLNALLRAMGENGNGVYAAFIATDMYLFPSNYGANINYILVMFGLFLLFISHMDLCCPLHILFKPEFWHKPPTLQLLSTRVMFGNQVPFICLFGMFSLLAVYTFTSMNQQFAKWFFIMYFIFSFIWNVVGSYFNCRYVAIDKKGTRADAITQFFVHFLYNLSFECCVFMSFNCVMGLKLCQTLG